MDPTTVFEWLNRGILVFWALLIFLPHHKITRIAVHSPLPVLGLTVFYLAFAVPGFLAGTGDGGFGTLDEVMKLFGTPDAVLAGWVHYLVFDLFIGAWEVRDAKRRGINHLALIPCLLLTLALGPVGLTSYLLLRYALKKEVFLAETN